MKKSKSLIRKYKISLSNNEDIIFITFRNLIEVIDWVTKEKNVKIYTIDKEGLSNDSPAVIFRKHIVKITEVK